MKKTTLTAAGLAALMSPLFGTLLLNEIHINMPDPGNTGSDSNYEFIELRSTTDGVEAGTGLTVLVIDNSGGQVGEVREAWSLDDLSTGSNGLLMIGDGYDTQPLAGPWSGFRDPATAVGDPSGDPPLSSMGSNDIGPNAGLTVLLVSGWTGLNNQTATSLGDVDVDNNSVLDWLQNPKPAGSEATQPWTSLLDSVGFRDRTTNPVRLPYCPASADLSGRPSSAPNFPPDSISRRLSHGTLAFANQSSAWYGGNIAGIARDSVAYDVQFFGDFKGQATPGEPNLDAAPAAPLFLINEVSINPPGPTDGNYEYVELINTVSNSGSSAASLQGYALLVVGSNDGNAGTDLGKILEAWDLGAFSTGSNGLLLLGNEYPVGFDPWGNLLDPATRLADPEAPANQPSPAKWSSMGSGDLADNNGFTLLLVQSFSGAVGQDLDANNDGVLDVQPWSAVKDSIGFDQAQGTGKTYAAARIVTSPFYDPDHLSRKLGNATPNSAGSWYGGDYGGNSAASIALKDEPAHPVFGGFRGAATPGCANLAAAAAPGPIRVNEVNLDPVASPDGSFEYVELLSTTFGVVGMNGLTLVIASAEPGIDNGRIHESIDLSGLSTGSNGLVIIGDSYDNISPYDTPQPLISPLTNREDPPGLGTANDIGPNAGLVVLIVKGTPPAVGSNVTAIAAADIVDSIGFGAVANAGVALMDPGFSPDNLSRYPTDQTANSPGAWFCGELNPADGDASVTYGTNYAGTYKGGASPGRYNHAASPDPAASLLINEININPPGGDNDKEFVEYRSSTDREMSTNGYTALLLDGNGSNTGSVLKAWSLDGLATGPNGLLLTGSGYAQGRVPWTGPSAPAAATAIGSPATMNFDDIGGASNNDATTMLLVKNFSGRIGDDLDAGTPPNNIGADDGSFDVSVWSALADAVGLRQWASAEVPPGLVGRVYAGVDLSQTGYTPDNLSRYRDALSPLSAGAWYGGDISGTAATSVGFDSVQRFPGGGFVGRVTPGQPNLPTLAGDAADTDGDSAPGLLEDALDMDPTVPDVGKLPLAGSVEVDGILAPTLSFVRPAGGTALNTNGYIHDGIFYRVQFSANLVTWTDGAQLFSAVSSSGTPARETATYRPTDAALAQGQAAGQMFLRLKVNRQ